MDGLVVDNFAGGGGASTGIAWAIGRDPDIAINHSPQAVAMHRANHPSTRHLIEDVWAVDPVKECRGRPVDLAWFSPDCTHFSRAKGGKPRSKKTRALAWVVIRWAKAVRPAVIMLENVEEFLTWGPVNNDGEPCRRRAGRTFKMWVGKLRALGYDVQWRSLVAADYGAPTTRKRLFLIARCDGETIVWPEPTYGRHRPRPWRAAAEVIDFSLPCPSIFERKKPLAEATLRRIGAGLRRYVWWLWYVVVPLALPLFGYFPGRRLRKVGDLPRGVMAQWQRWCRHRDYAVGVEGEPVRRQYAAVTTPIVSLSFTDDEFMSARNTESLHGFYTGAQRTMKRIAPNDVGAKGIGHFGFFRHRFAESLWARHLLPELN